MSTQRIRSCQSSNACLACSRRLTPPRSRFCASHAVCTEMNAVLLPLATTILEDPCGKLGKSVSGLTRSFGMNQCRVWDFARTVDERACRRLDDLAADPERELALEDMKPFILADGGAGLRC